MKSELIQKIMETGFCPAMASGEFYELLMQLAINIISLLILCRAIYFRWNHKAEYMFSQLITGMVVFIICALLRWVKIELGLALGLFAIFAIIRFRTINVPVKEMTYQFMVVGVSAVNALLSVRNCIQWILISNILLVVLTLILERTFFTNQGLQRSILIDNMDLLKPAKHKALEKELRSITGLDIISFEIGNVDYIKKHAQISIYFRKT